MLLSVIKELVHVPPHASGCRSPSLSRPSAHSRWPCRHRNGIGAKCPTNTRGISTHIYPSDEAWRAAKDKLVAEFPKLKAFKGTLGSSAARLADALELGTRLSKEFARAYVYASMMSDTDTRVSKYQGMQQEMIQLGSMLGAEAAFIEPEILKLDKATVDKFVAGEPRLKVYRLYLDDIQRRAAAHPHRRGGTPARERRRHRQRTVGHLRHLLGRRLPLPERDAERWQERPARQLRLQPLPRRPEPRGPQEGHGRVLRRARQVPGHVRLDAQRSGAVGHLLRARPQVQQRARGLARRSERPDLGLHAPHRRREPAPARRSTAT